MVLHREEITNWLPTAKKVSIENMQVTLHVLNMLYLGINTNTYMHRITINEKRGPKFEG